MKSLAPTQKTDVTEVTDSLPAPRVRKSRSVPNSPKSFPCNTCDKVFDRASGLERHVRIHTNDRRYKCDVCQKTFIESAHLINHSWLHKPEAEMPFQCIPCSSGFCQSRSLQSHLRTQKHQLRLQGLSGEPSDASTQRSQETAEELFSQSLEKTEKINSGQSKTNLVSGNQRATGRNNRLMESAALKTQPVERQKKKRGRPSEKARVPLEENDQPGILAEEIGSVLEGARESELSAGQIGSQVEVPSKFSVEIDESQLECSGEKSSFRSKSLVRTQRTDAAVMTDSSPASIERKNRSVPRAFPCNTCGMVFEKKVCLKMHVRIHTNDRPYKCDVCQKAFIQTGHLIQHSWLHKPEAERPFQCIPCGSGFCQSSVLQYHLRSQKHQIRLKELSGEPSDASMSTRRSQETGQELFSQSFEKPELASQINSGESKTIRPSDHQQRIARNSSLLESAILNTQPVERQKKKRGRPSEKARVSLEENDQQGTLADEISSVLEETKESELAAGQIDFQSVSRSKSSVKNESELNCSGEKTSPPQTLKSCRTLDEPRSSDLEENDSRPSVEMINDSEPFSETASNHPGPSVEERSHSRPVDSRFLLSPSALHKEDSLLDVEGCDLSLAFFEDSDDSRTSLEESDVSRPSVDKCVDSQSSVEASHDSEPSPQESDLSRPCVIETDASQPFVEGNAVLPVSSQARTFVEEEYQTRPLSTVLPPSRRFECEGCAKCFDDVSGLKKHMMRYIMKAKTSEKYGKLRALLHGE